MRYAINTDVGAPLGGTGGDGSAGGTEHNQLARPRPGLGSEPEPKSGERLASLRQLGPAGSGGMALSNAS